MRRSLFWGLAATTVLSAVALLVPDKPAVIANVEPRIRQHQADLAQVMSAQPSPPAPNEPLPTAWPTTMLDAAKRDIFFASAVASPAPPPTPIPVAPAPAADVQAAPPSTYRFLGKMQSPEGETLVYLTQGQREFPVKVGDHLDDGYVVEAISPGAVALLYPALNVRTTVTIPLSPQ